MLFVTPLLDVIAACHIAVHISANCSESSQYLSIPMCVLLASTSVLACVHHTTLFAPRLALQCAGGMTDTRTDRQTDEQTDGQTETPTRRQTDRQTDRDPDSSAPTFRFLILFLKLSRCIKSEFAGLSSPMCRLNIIGPEAKFKLVKKTQKL